MSTPRQPGASRPSWWGPVAAAVALAVVAGLAWWGLRPRAGEPSAASTTVVTVSPSPTTTAGPTPTPSVPSTTPSATSVPPTTSQALPVFYAGPELRQAGAERWVLAREFVRVDVPAGVDASALATAAVGLALRGAPDPNPNGYAGAWPAGTTATVRVEPGAIEVTISAAGSPALSPERQKIAVQQLVWTATAAAQSAGPVSISVAGGGPIFDGVPAGTFSRPPSETDYEVLSPIWVDAPAAGAVLPAGSPVVATGLACVFEGHVEWELQHEGATVKDGYTQAASGCPGRGAWKVDLGALPAGDYTLRMFTETQDGGGLGAQHLVPFRVG